MGFSSEISARFGGTGGEALVRLGGEESATITPGTCFDGVDGEPDSISLKLVRRGEGEEDMKRAWPHWYLEVGLDGDWEGEGEVLGLGGTGGFDDGLMSLGELPSI